MELSWLGGHTSGDLVNQPLSTSPGWLRRLAGWGDHILDPSIVFAFDQSGFLRHQIQFDPSDLDMNMTGRVCLITGANSGLGLATALALADRGASVWLLCRNMERGSAAAQSVREQTGNPHVFVEQVDVSDPASIKALVGRLPCTSVDVLVNNAGVLLDERSVAKGGLETTLATNLVGPLQLTAALLSHLKAGERSRVIFVSSGGMYTQRLDVDRLLEPSEPFDGVVAYAQTKRAMVAISERLAALLCLHGIGVHCMHPGWANTPGVERSIPAFWKLTRPILRSPTSGADTIVWLSVCDKAQDSPGQFWFDRKPRKTHLLLGTKASEEEEHRLWDEVHMWSQIDPSIWEKEE